MASRPRPQVGRDRAAARLDALRDEPFGIAGGWVPRPPVPDASAVDVAGADPNASDPVASDPVASDPVASDRVVGDPVRDALLDGTPRWAHGLVERASGRMAAGCLAVIVAASAGVGYAVAHHRSTGAGGSASYPGGYGTDSDSGSGSGDDSGATQSSTMGSAGAASAAAGSSGTGSTDTGSTGAGSIVVDVGGRVRHPGLVTLPAGSRVADAVAAAGGARRPQDLASVDLASKVMDGQLLVIGPATSGASGAAAPSAPESATGTGGSVTVDLNTADLDQLETLPGVGPVTAQKILTWRDTHDGFTAVAQLQQVPGIGPAHYAEISPLVTT